MNKLKMTYAYNHLIQIVVCLLFSLYLNNLFVYLIVSLYIIIHLSLKDLLIFLSLILVILIRLSLNIIDTKVFYIKDVKANYYVASNVIYDVSVYSDEKYNYGDIIYLKDRGNSTEKLDKAKNIYYKYYTNKGDKLIFHVPNLRSYLWNNFNHKQDCELKDFIGQMVFNYKDYDNQYYQELVVNLSPYFIYLFLLKLMKRYKYKELVAFIILFNIYGLTYNIFRILIFEIFKKLINKKSIALSLSILALIILNPYSIFSYSFIIPVLIRLFLYFKTVFNFKMIISLIQSYFFYEFNFLNILFYKEIMTFLSITKLVFIIELAFNIEIISNLLFKVYSFVSPVFNISFKGQISILFIIILFLFIKCFHIENDFIKVCITILFITSNISNIFGSVSFIDVGQGDAILIKDSFNRHNILIDTGSKYNYYKLDRLLKKKGIYNIDQLIITHLDSDHSDNINNLIYDYGVDKINFKHQDLSIGDFNFISLNANNYDNENDNSLVYYLNYNHLNFLFTGDISKYVEEDIIANYPNLNIDILKLSHHGSKTGTSEYLIINNNIKLAIASTSGNYNHPHKSIIDLLDKWQIPLLNTKYVSNIEIIMSKFFNIVITDSGEFVIIRG